MRALTATIQIVLNPRVIGPDAPTSWSGDLADASACDYVSELLTFEQAETVIDWQYIRVDDSPLDFGWKIIELDPDNYEEGEAFASA